MQKRQITIGWTLAAATALAWMLSLPVCAHAQVQHMAIPAYFYPGPIWTQMDAGAPTVGIAILNVDSGPGTAKEANFANEVTKAQAAGILVLGYVYTSYGARPNPAVELATRRYFNWYHVDGILYDEVAADSSKLDYYKKLYAYVKSLSSTSTVMINPGTQTIKGYMNACDIECNFESEYSAYETQYTAPDWVSKYPASRFCHIIYNVPTDADMQTVVSQSKLRNAGWVFVTPLTLPNPYNNLPTDPYWSDELTALAASS
jgi:hypothetical protein